MIVACSACNTRFRVADEKIGPLGARIRCSRCGQTFQVPPPPAPEAVAPALAPEPTPSFLERPPAPEGHPPVATEPTGTGGWPTGVLEVAGGASGVEPSASVRLTLESDPFAAFAAQSGEPAPQSAPLEGDIGGPDFLGSLPVTDLSALERTGAVPLAPSSPPGPGSEDGLSLEDRTPTAMPVREGPARWDEPSASQAIEVGPDGFQEVDLASGGMGPDPGFDPLAGEPTRESPLIAGPPQGIDRGAAPPEPPPATDVADAPDAPRERAAADVPAGRAPASRLRPERVRAVAMNVLSLAALLVVTLGIVLWWRGEGMGALLRWPRSGNAGVDVSRISSGVYEGSHGQSVVFVRGVVHATQDPVEGPVLVRVLLERGGKRLGDVTATAGAVPRAEELAAARSPEDLEVLRQRLDAGAPTRLEPGAGLPFLAVLPVPEGDLGAIRFRVEPVPARGR